MPQIQYTIKYKKNEGLVMSSGELLTLYLYGINLKSRDGSSIPQESISFFIRSAQEQVEKFLKIKFSKQLETENLSYYRDDYLNQFPQFKTSFLVNTPLSLIGLLNRTEQVVYPIQWLNSRQDSSLGYYRKICIVPTGAGTVNANQDVILTGITNYLGLRTFPTIPNYWSVQYLTGYEVDDLPMDVVNVIGKLAAINLLIIAGDLILGPGISSISLGVDGLNQNISSALSAQGSALGARIKQYTADINVMWKQLKRFYQTLNFTVL